MPPRTLPFPREPQEQPKPGAQAPTKKKKINVHRLAEKLLTLAAEAPWSPPSRGKAPLEWLRSLTDEDYRFVLVNLHANCLVSTLTEKWVLPDAKTLTLPSLQASRIMAKELGGVTEERFWSVWPEIVDAFDVWYSGSPRDIDAQAPTTDDSTVAEEDDRIIRKRGIRYFPLSLAAEIGQVPRTTLVDWIKTKKFAGLPLQTYNSPTANKIYLSEESVRRLANRFVKWDAEKKERAGPAGPVRIAKAFAKTRDQSGYIGLPKAAKAIGADYHTLWLWATQGKEAPANKSLDVIQDTASEQFYIRHKDVEELKPLVPKSGLRRGRRPQPRHFN